MIRFSERIKSIKESGTVRIVNAVAALRAQGKRIISLSAGEPDFATPPHIVAAAKLALDEGRTYYTPSNGIPELRAAIAKRLQTANRIPCSAENIIVTPAKHAIFMIIMALVDSDDEVLIPDPGWVTYEACVRFAGGKPVYAPPEPNAMDRAITNKTRLIVLNTPSNPTGSVLGRSELEKIAEIAHEHELVVLSDEIYENIIYEGEHVSIASLPDMFERTVTVSGFSKSYAMTGWRIGWLCAPKEIFVQLAKLQQHTVTCAPSFVQHAAVVALRESQEPVEKMCEEFRKRRDFVVKRLNAMPGIHCPMPQGAFYVFPKYEYRMNSLEFAEYLLHEAGVALTPGIEFGPAGEYHVRISYAASMNDLKEAMEKMDAVLTSVIKQ